MSVRFGSVFGSVLSTLLLLAPAHLALAHSRRAVELETRLFAPCCYVQTLDVHESDLADKLRAEIERRLTAGEHPRNIEDDLVNRYGERIRAVPRDHDPRSSIPLLVGSLLSLGLIALSGFALHWQRTQRDRRKRIGPTDGAPEALSQADGDYDLRLDEALRKSSQDETGYGLSRT